MRLKTRFPFVSVIVVNGVLVPFLLGLKDPLIYQEFAAFANQIESPDQHPGLQQTAALEFLDGHRAKRLRHWQTFDVTISNQAENLGVMWARKERAPTGGELRHAGAMVVGDSWSRPVFCD